MDNRKLGERDASDRGHHKRQGTRRVGGEQTEQVGEGTLAPKLIVAFVVVAVLAIGGFALWRTFGAQEPQEEPQEEVKVKHEVPIDAKSEARVERLMADLSLEQKVAQLFIVTPEDITGVDTVVAAGDATREAITKYPVGGIIYNTANLTSPEQTKEMLRNTQYYAKDACGLPLFTCVDEEGGTVARVAKNPSFDVVDVGDMAKIGATGDAEKARDAAYAIGSYLKELGFNVDFAPVADIATSDDGTMADRSFGSTPDEVSPMVAAQVEGFTRAGILCAAKHFPGIGGAEGDSHNERIYSSKSADEMLAWSCVPFRAAIEQSVPMIMVGHLSCTELGNKSDVPASLNSAVMEDLLRDELGYNGVVVTDSFQMKAVTQACDAKEQGVRAIQAGADIVLMPEDFEDAYKGLLDAVKSGEVPEERIDESVRRVIIAKLAIGA